MIKHVVCAVSGGVDSAVSALLLKRKGFRVSGVFMRNWDITDEKGHCSADRDLEDAIFVCRHLDIPLHEVNFVREYWNDVFSQLVRGYETGQTPNPDVLCNKHIKFGRLYEHAIGRLGGDAMATGHYARSSAGQFLELADRFGEVKLLTAVDQTKDQTLFLSHIPQGALRRTMFPVGGLRKSVVKQLAMEAGLDSIVRKKESTGICFIGTRHFQSFIDEYIEPRRGNFVDVDTGAIVGEHKGVHCWTIGQRALIGGLSQAYFVVARHPSTQTIFVGRGTDHPALFCDSMLAGPMHWISGAGAPSQLLLAPPTNPASPTDKNYLASPSELLHPAKILPQGHSDFSGSHDVGTIRSTSINDELNLSSRYELSSEKRQGDNSALCDDNDNYSYVKHSESSYAERGITLSRICSAQFESCNTDRKESSAVTQSDAHCWPTEAELSALPAMRCRFRFQHPHDLMGARVRRLSAHTVHVELDAPLRALTRGQYAVLYSAQEPESMGECLGGGVIMRVGPSRWEREKTEQSVELKRSGRASDAFTL